MSVGGAVDLWPGKGFGLGVAVNVITDTVNAYLLDSTVEQTGGSFEVSSLIDIPGAGQAKIVAITASFGKGTTNGGAGMVGVNVVDDHAYAYLQNSSAINATVTGFTVHAEDDSSIYGIGGAVGIGSSGTGVGIALAFNSSVPTSPPTSTTARLPGATGATPTAYPAGSRSRSIKTPRLAPFHCGSGADDGTARPSTSR